MEDPRLVEAGLERGVDGARRIEVVADRFLQHQPRRRPQQAGAVEPDAGGLEQVRRRRQVADRGAVGVRRQRRRDRVGVGEVERVVMRALQQFGQQGEVAFVGQSPAQPVAEAGVVVLAAADRDHAETFRQRPVAQQVQQRGEQVATGEVAGGAEQQQRVEHAVFGGVAAAESHPRPLAIVRDRACRAASLHT